MKYATLKNIAGYLNIPGTGKNKNYALALMFLPDILDPDLLENPSDAIYWSSPKSQHYLIRGNYSESSSIETKGGEELAIAAGEFSSKVNTKDLLAAIRNNDTIIYKNGLGLVRVRDNMRQKLDYLLDRTSLVKQEALFRELEILPFLRKEDHEQVSSIIQALAQKRNYSYALFLLVLTAVFRGEIEQLKFLYSPDEIQKVLLNRNRGSLPDDCIYFTDSKYTGKEYQVFLYRSLHGEDTLFSKGTFIIDDSGPVPVATLELKDDFKEPCAHRFVGTPMLTGKTVYIPMGDKLSKNALGILCFEYENFAKNLPMYFRSGLFLSSHFRFHTPQVQKVVLTLKKREEMSTGDETAIRGQLRTSGSNIAFNREELKEFCSSPAVRNESWISKFQRWILPALLQGDFSNCCISEETIRNFPKGDFSSQELTKIAFAFKDYSESHWRKKNTFINCLVPEDFHYLMRGEGEEFLPPKEQV